MNIYENLSLVNMDGEVWVQKTVTNQTWKHLEYN